MKKTALIISTLAIILLVVLGAGCVNSDSNSGNGQLTTPVEDTNKVTVADVAGIWYSTNTFQDGDTIALLKIEINPDGTGAETWYYNKDVSPYFYNTFRITQLTNGTSDLEDKGMFSLIFDPPLSSNKWCVTGNSEGLESTLGVSFSKTPIKEYWRNYEEPKPYPTPEITKEHNPEDYVENGNYYLEDDNGRSFTKTLWTGDITPYIAEYKSLPNIANGGYQAGEWIQNVRGLSKVHHVFEPTNSVHYQTIDETMNRGSGTCDDLVILAARGLKELGFDVCILVFPDHMNIGIAEKHYQNLKNYVTGNWYATYQSSNPIVYDGYYLIDIANWQNNTGLGEICTEGRFKYNMTLKKMIVL